MSVKMNEVVRALAKNTENSSVYTIQFRSILGMPD
jgi:hypothetical protein